MSSHHHLIIAEARLALLVRTLIGPSTIAGTGLFAVDHIAKGTRIWEFTPNFDRVYNDISAFPASVIAYLTTYCYRNAGNYVFCADHAKFFNHADHPSCDDDENFTYAARDIEAGDELTSDYRKFGVTNDDMNFNVHGLLPPTSSVPAQ